jgi:hypothetical protein
MLIKILKIVKNVFNEGIQLIHPNDHVNPFDPIFWEAKLNQTPPKSISNFKSSPTCNYKFPTFNHQYSPTTNHKSH